MDKFKDSIKGTFWGGASPPPVHDNIQEDDHSESKVDYEKPSKPSKAVVVKSAHASIAPSEQEQQQEKVVKPPHEHVPHAVQVDKYDWTHPLHPVFAFAGLTWQVVSLCFLLVAEFMVNWYIDASGAYVNKYRCKVVCGEIPLADMAPVAKCAPHFYDDDHPNPVRCSYDFGVNANSSFQDGTNDAFMFGVQLEMWASIGLTAVAVVVHGAVWPVWMLTDKLYSVLLKAVLCLVNLSAFVKLLAGCELVYVAIKLYETAVQRVCSTDLHLNVLLQGFLFFSAIADMVAVLAILVALDRGNDAESHWERFEREKAERKNRDKELREAKKDVGERRPSSYAPDSGQEHAELIRKVSSVLHSEVTGKQQ